MQLNEGKVCLGPSLRVQSTLKGRVWQQKHETACHSVAIVRNNRKIYSIPSSFSPLYSIWDPSLENGVTNIQGKSSNLSDLSHRHAQKVFFSNIFLDPSS